MKALRVLAASVCVALAPTAVEAQTGGTIAGRVRDAASGIGLEGAQLVVIGQQRSATADTGGVFRIRQVPPGWHRVRVTLVGYRPMVRESVLVRSGETSLLDVRLQRRVDTLAGIDVRVAPDVVLDPTVTATVQRVTAEDLRSLPVSTLDEAIALQAGTVGESFRGGRAGQQSFVLDGLGIKNQLDASTAGLGLRIPPEMLTEASLITNGFSARYGQAISGMINVATRDGGERWLGRIAYETDRPLAPGADFGLDRFVAYFEGPLFRGITLAAAADAVGRLDADPVNAPPPSDPRDPRFERPYPLPHNGGEQVDLTAKLRVPLGRGGILRLFALQSVDQRELFDPAYKYDLAHAPARRTVGHLASGHWSFATRSDREAQLALDLRVARFTREFIRAPLADALERRFGAFTGRRFRFMGENIARAQDTALASGAVPGFAPPAWSVNTPWGVPAFFLGRASRGDLAWNRFSEWRAQLDASVGGRGADLLFGGEIVRQRVQTFQRVRSYQPVGDSVPPATASDFSPQSLAGYVELQARWDDLAFTWGIRLDRFDPRNDAAGSPSHPRVHLGPRLGVSTVLRGATVVVSWGRFAQAPDYQYLVDAAFDDTLRTGRFRAGNPNLGYETATQYEFSLRARPWPGIAFRVGAYVKQLDDLVASVPFGVHPDSSIFGNTDYGNVRGVEVQLEREFAGWWGARLMYSLQHATATVSDAFRLWRVIRLTPGTGDPLRPARVEFPLDYDRRHGLTVVGQARVPVTFGPSLMGVQPLAGWECALVARYQTGLPYTRTNATGDSLIGLPNSYRLPSQHTVDLLVRRPLELMGLRGSAYLDVRNLTNRRNLIAVRRDTGTPVLDGPALEAAARAAYQAHPEPIPYESPRYRPWADLDSNGLVEGEAELLPLYRSAARDAFQPLFFYGPPRLFRLGLEFEF